MHLSISIRSICQIHFISSTNCLNKGLYLSSSSNVIRSSGMKSRISNIVMGLFYEIKNVIAVVEYYKGTRGKSSAAKTTATTATTAVQVLPPSSGQYMLFRYKENIHFYFFQTIIVVTIIRFLLQLGFLLKFSMQMNRGRLFAFALLGSLSLFSLSLLIIFSACFCSVLFAMIVFCLSLPCVGYYILFHIILTLCFWFGGFWSSWFNTIITRHI